MDYGTPRNRTATDSLQQQMSIRPASANVFNPPRSHYSHDTILRMPTITPELPVKSIQGGQNGLSWIEDGIVSPSPRRLMTPSRLNTVQQDLYWNPHSRTNSLPLYLHKKFINLKEVTNAAIFPNEEAVSSSTMDVEQHRVMNEAGQVVTIPTPMPEFYSTSSARVADLVDSSDSENDSVIDDDEESAAATPLQNHHLACQQSKDDIVKAMFELHQIVAGIPLMNSRRPSVSEGFIASSSLLSQILVDSRQEVHYGGWQRRIVEGNSPAKIPV